MIRGTTQTFNISFVNSLDIKTIKSYCLSFGRNERKQIFDIFEERKVGTNSGDTQSSISFKRARISATTSATDSKQTVTMTISLTEEESLSLPIGDVYVQLKLGFGNGEAINSSQFVINVESSLCSKEMNAHV